MLCPYHPPPQKRHNLQLGLAGGGGRIQSGVERKGKGCDYHKVDDEDDNDGKRGKQGKSINDSISEHKGIVMLRESWYHMRVEVKLLVPLLPVLSLPSE
jgi:hypothetical protein